MKVLEERIKEFAGDKVPYSLINVHQIPGKTDKEAQIASLERVARANDTGSVIIPVKHGVLMQGEADRKDIEWAMGIMGRRIILVCGSNQPINVPLNRPLRVLIPILQKLHEGPFEVACAFNTDNIVPDVEVIAAKVLELPTDSSQYSIYSQDSQSIGDEHLTFIKTHLSRDMQRIVHPMVLPVHDAGKDITDFAKAREVDLIMMEGVWSPEGQGILTQVEADIVSKVNCTVVVTMVHYPIEKEVIRAPEEE